MMHAETHAQLRMLLDRVRHAEAAAHAPEVRTAHAIIERLVKEVGQMIREVDPYIASLREEGSTDPEFVQLLADMSALRARLTGHMRRFNPDQAWFWTENWQEGERTVDRNIAEGRLLGPFTDEEFDAHLRALRPDLAEV